VIDPDDPKVRWATFGKQVEDFLTSDIGDYLLKSARRQELEAVEQLKHVSPWRRRKIIQLQNRILVSESIQTWLGDAVAAGQAAMEQIKEEQT
jgi:hypothetical protein